MVQLAAAREQEEKIAQIVYYDPFIDAQGL